VEAQAAEKPDPVANLVGILKLVIASEADPYLLSGVLVEGIASTILYQRLLNPTLAPHVMAGPTSWPGLTRPSATRTKLRTMQSQSATIRWRWPGRAER